MRNFVPARFSKYGHPQNFSKFNISEKKSLCVTKFAIREINFFAVREIKFLEKKFSPTGKLNSRENFFRKVKFWVLLLQKVLRAKVLPGKNLSVETFSDTFANT